MKVLRRAEIPARIHALARRSAVTPAKAVIARGEVPLDSVWPHAQLGGETLARTGKEFVLAAYMLKNPRPPAHPSGTDGKRFAHQPEHRHSHRGYPH